MTSPPPFGLCDSCRHQRLVRTTRGSTFSLCERSRREPEYPRYPRVPVLSCAGHEPRTAQPVEDVEEDDPEEDDPDEEPEA